MDEQTKPYLFHMEFRNNTWIIIGAPEVPHWIHELEEKLGRAILVHEQP